MMWGISWVSSVTVLHEMAGFSSYPYATSPASKYEERAKRFNWAFKNGRGYDERKSPTFPDVVRGIVRGVDVCPAFSKPSVLVPIPRSGSSRVSFQPDACAWPVLELAQALVAGGHRVELLLDRPVPIRRSSDGVDRVSVEEHATSVRTRIEPGLLAARIVLLDDLLVRGTQAIACMLALRRSGYTGVIESYFVHQSVAPHPTPDQRKPFLRHRLLWEEGQRLARRLEAGFWREQLPSSAARW